MLCCSAPRWRSRSATLAKPPCSSSGERLRCSAAPICSYSVFGTSELTLTAIVALPPTCSITTASVQGAPPGARRPSAALTTPAAQRARCDAAQRTGPAAAAQVGGCSLIFINIASQHCPQQPAIDAKMQCILMTLPCLLMVSSAGACPLASCGCSMGASCSCTPTGQVSISIHDSGLLALCHCQQVPL
jgi:hypothetical protein